MNICVYAMGEANIELWSKKIALWQQSNLKINLVCPIHAAEKYQHFLKNVNFLTVKANPVIFNRFHYIYESLLRTIRVFTFFSRISKHSQIIISISAVLDLLIFPFFVKFFRPSIKWIVLFENEVIWSQNNNFIVNLLATFFYRISLKLLHLADSVFVVTSDLKEVLIKEGINQDKVIITGNAVDTNTIKQLSVVRSSFLCDALYMGRINKNKGVFDLVKITDIVVKKVPSFSLWLVGGGDSQTIKLLNLEIEKKHLQPNIRLIGPLTGKNKFQILQGSKLFLSPSYYESFGVALLEAVSCGVKAIAYRLPVFKSIYRNHEVMLVPIGDYEHFAQVLINQLAANDFDNHQGRQLLQSGKYAYEKISHIEVEAFKHLF